MIPPLLNTKLYAPPTRPPLLTRPHLLAKLSEHLPRKLTLISAPAGFGKTTLLSEWIAHTPHPAAWLSLDEEDRPTTRFLLYLIAALQTIAPSLGKELLSPLQSPHPPPTEALLTILLNDISALSNPIHLVLDDYHTLESPPIDQAMAFLLKHLPPQLHLVIATREDPPLPLARLRAQGQMLELRAEDLRFHPDETTQFFQGCAALSLTQDQIITLAERTEGWIAGLQLAALSMRGSPDPAPFVRSFSKSHHFAMDYLLEEVLQKQPSTLQDFLLKTSVLRRFCASLCDALFLTPSASAQTTLDLLVQSNLFVVPLDNERRWYRYHHLFGGLLRQRLEQSPPSEGGIAALHRRACRWFEANGLEEEAFEHAVASGDIALCARLVEGNGMPLHFRGIVAPVLRWLSSLPKSAMDARPSLWVIYASTLLFVGQTTQAEQAIQAAEIALQGTAEDQIRDLLGHIAAIHATLAVAHHNTDAIFAQSQRALAYLHHNNLPVQTAMRWTLGYAYHLQGQRAAAQKAYQEAVTTSRAIGHTIIQITSTIGLAMLQEANNHLHQAAQTHRELIATLGRFPPPVISEAYFGLARIAYEWNDLSAAQQYIDTSLQHAQSSEISHRIILYKLFLVRLRFAQNDPHTATQLWAEAKRDAQQTPAPPHTAQEIATYETRFHLLQGQIAQAETIARTHQRPDLLARVFFAKADESAALGYLDDFQSYIQDKDWNDEQQKAAYLRTLLLYASGQQQQALQRLRELLWNAEPQGFLRLFLDETAAALPLFSAFCATHPSHTYAHKILSTLQQELAIATSSPSPRPSQATPSLTLPKNTAVSSSSPQPPPDRPLSLSSPPASPTASLPSNHTPPSQDYPPLFEPLSPREREVLQLIEQGLSNHDISKRLFVSLSTIKGHNQRIFAKLGVRRRTEALARARSLGLL